VATSLTTQFCLTYTFFLKSSIGFWHPKPKQHFDCWLGYCIQYELFLVRYLVFCGNFSCQRMNSLKSKGHERSFASLSRNGGSLTHLRDVWTHTQTRAFCTFIVRLKVPLSQVDVHLNRSEVNKWSASCMLTSECHSQVMHTPPASFAL
jgi:hypothetical protein